MGVYPMGVVVRAQRAALCFVAALALGGCAESSASTSDLAGALPSLAQEIRLPIGGQDGVLVSVSCLSAGECTAIGGYSATGSSGLPVAASESGGVWDQGEALAAPTAANTFRDLRSVSCTGAGDCVSVGNDEPSSVVGPIPTPTTSRPVIVSETGGVWGTAEAVTLPADASGQYASLDSVACQSPGNCVAVGGYEAASTGYPMVITETDGVWGRAAKLTLPPPFSNKSRYGLGTLESVSCASAGNCTAVGQYLPSGIHGAIMMIVTEVNGVWGPATGAARPSGAAQAGGGAGLAAVACPSVGECVAVGDYIDKHGAFQAMVISQARGRWGRVQQLTLPADADTSLGTGGGLNGVACVTEGNCFAVGTYRRKAGHIVPIIAPETNGRWGGFQTPPLPANAATTGSESTDLKSVACTSAGTCVTVGTYGDRSGKSEPVALSNGP